MVCSNEIQWSGIPRLYGRELLARIVGGWGSVLFILNLGCEVVADVANVADVVLNHQGHVGGHGQRHLETMRNIISIISFQYLLKAGCSALLNV